MRYAHVRSTRLIGGFMNKNIVIMSILSGLFSAPSHAVFYAARVLEGRPLLDQHTLRVASQKRVILLSEVHTECEDPTQVAKQQNGVVHYALASKAYVIAEDSADVRRALLGKKAKQRIQNSGKSADSLGGLMQLCEDKNIPHANVEFRFSRDAFIQYMIAIKKEQSAMKRAVELSAEKKHTIAQLQKRALLETENVLAETRRRISMQPLLSDYYTSICTEVIEKGNQLLSNTNDLANLDMQTWAKEVRTFDYKLIDARIMHEIATCPQSTVIVCAGGDHIDNIVEVLQEKLGYVEQAVHAQIKQINVVQKMMGNAPRTYIAASTAVDVTEFFKDIDYGYYLTSVLKKFVAGGLLCALGYCLYKALHK